MAPRLPRWMLVVFAAAVLAAGALGAGLMRDGRSPVDVTAADTGDQVLAASAPVPAPAPAPAELGPPAPVTTVPDPAPPASAVQAAQTRPTAASTPPEPVVERAPAAVAPAGEDLSPGTYHEQPDTANFVVLPAGPPAPGGSATSLNSGPERLRFDVVLTGDGTFTARVVNVSGRTMRFAGGLHIAGEVALEGRPWRTFDLVDAATTTLAPGQQASVATSFSLDRPGQYTAWGSTDVEIV